MRRSRGFVSLFILGLTLLLLTLGLLFSFFLGRNSRLESLYIRDAHLRNLVYPAMVDLVEENPTSAGSETVACSLDSEGKRANLTRTVAFSSDGKFRSLSVVAEGDGGRFGMHNYSYFPGTSIDSLPCLDAKIARSISLAEIKQNGFGQYIAYCNGNLSIPKGTYRCNSLVVVYGNLTIASDTTFSGRIIFLVGKGSSGKSKVTIGSNVTMEDGVIFSEAAVNIGAGCRLNGYFNSGVFVKAVDADSIVVDPDALRPFHSVSYVF